MKISHVGVGAVVLASFIALDVQAQNVGIGFPNPLSKLTVNGNFAVGADYNFAAPANGAIIEGRVGIGTTTPNSTSQLHVYSPNQALELIEAGGAVSGNWADLRLQMDASSNHHTVIEMTNATTSNGFQLWTDPSDDNSNDFAIYDLAAGAWRVWLNPSGYLGIGTTDPIAPLDVQTFSTLTETGGVRTFFDFATTPQLTQQTVTTTQNVASAIFSQSIFTGNAFISYGGTLSASDARLKNVIGRSNGAKDLQTLLNIEVTDYTMKDTVTYGDRPLKKVVAQQVEQVYPTAVRSIGLKGVTFTPDIYAVSDSIKSEKPDVYTITMTSPHGLKDGEMIRVIPRSNDKELHLVAQVVNDKAFMVETKETLGAQVFVYGKQCTDLKAVDYDAISMLNVSATQELAKKVETLEKQNSQLQDENKRLTAVEEQDHAKIATLEASNEKLAAMAAKIDVLEKALATMQDKENGLQKAVLQ